MNGPEDKEKEAGCEHDKKDQNIDFGHDNVMVRPHIEMKKEYIEERIHCAICDMSIPIKETFRCKRCGRLICQRHKNTEHLVCENCADIICKKEKVSGKPTAYLLVTAGINRGDKWGLAENQLKIGRNIENDIIIHQSDLKASRKHAVINFSNGAHLIQDIGSGNGTYLNAERIAGEKLLKHGDVIEIGSTKMQYLAGIGEIEHPTVPLDIKPDVTMIGDIVDHKTIQVKATLVVRNRSGTEEENVLNEKKMRKYYRIGRDETNDIRIPDTDRFASRNHAHIIPKNGSYYIRDACSSNGTYVNNKKIDKSTRLNEGDVIRVGEHVIDPFADKTCKMDGINIRKDFPIGRCASNAVVVDKNDKHASRHHATIIYNDGEYYLEDIGSKNGTYVNKIGIERMVRLNDGDLIRVGDTELRFHCG